MRSWGLVAICSRRSGGWVIAWWNRTRGAEGGGAGAPLREAIQALRAELEGGARAHLGREVRELAELLARRERRRGTLERDPLEHELLAAMPDAAALVSKEGWVRVSNSAFDTLAVTGRALGLTPLEITRSAELSEAVKRALEGTTRKLELAIGRGIYRAHLAPLLRGEVLLLLRDVTETNRSEAARRDFVLNASHELKTPIAAIRAAAETLAHGGGLDDREAARGFVDIVERNAERLSHLVGGPPRPLAHRDAASGSSRSRRSTRPRSPRRSWASSPPPRPRRGSRSAPSCPRASRSAPTRARSSRCS